MEERRIILDALTDCKDDMEYRESRLEEVGNSNRTIRNNLKEGIKSTWTRIETIIEVVHMLGIINEDEARMNYVTLIDTIASEY